MTSPITLTVTLPRETCEVYLRAGMMPGGVSSAVARAIERWAREEGWRPLELAQSRPRGDGPQGALDLEDV